MKRTRAEQEEAIRTLTEHPAWEVVKEGLENRLQKVARRCAGTRYDSLADLAVDQEVYRAALGLIVNPVAFILGPEER